VNIHPSGPPKKHPSTLSRNSIRVLVVDDFPPFTNALVNIFQTNFYDALGASDAAEALAIAEDFKPHALIADVILPGMDGFELAAEFEKRYPDCRVLLTSASPAGFTKNGEGPRVVPKVEITEEAFRLLESCRTSAKD
jgi:PleD family two-component response regulator